MKIDGRKPRVELIVVAINNLASYRIYIYGLVYLQRASFFVVLNDDHVNGVVNFEVEMLRVIVSHTREKEFYSFLIIRSRRLATDRGLQFISQPPMMWKVSSSPSKKDFLSPLPDPDSRR